MIPVGFRQVSNRNRIPAGKLLALRMESGYPSLGYEYDVPKEAETDRYSPTEQLMLIAHDWPPPMPRHLSLARLEERGTATVYVGWRG